MCHIIFTLWLCARVRSGCCSTSSSELSGWSYRWGRTTNKLTGRGVRDELMCSQDDYHPSSLPGGACLSKARVNAGCEDSTGDATWYCLMIQHSRKAWFLATSSTGIWILSYGTRLDSLSTAVIFASKLGSTVFLSVPTKARGDKTESSPNLETKMGQGKG